MRSSNKDLRLLTQGIYKCSEKNFKSALDRELKMFSHKELIHKEMRSALTEFKTYSVLFYFEEIVHLHMTAYPGMRSKKVDKPAVSRSWPWPF